LNILKIINLFMNKRIIYLSNYIFNLGGIERYNRDFINELYNQDVTVDVIMRMPGGILSKFNFIIDDETVCEGVVITFDKERTDSITLDISKNNVDILVNLSATLIDLERHEEALTVCDQIIQIQPEQKNAWINKAFALSQLKRYQEAIRTYQRVMQLDPSDMHNLRNCGIAYYENHQADQAQKLLEEVSQKLSHDTLTWCFLGLSHYQLGNTDFTITSLENSLKLDPQNLEVPQHLGRCLLKIGQFKRGLEQISRSTGSIVFNLDKHKVYIHE
jgi:tetratricopeptide (TPR) repeat protein